jgi:hypothetical protein
MASKLDELMALVRSDRVAMTRQCIAPSKENVRLCNETDAALQSALKAVVEDAKRWNDLKQEIERILSASRKP